MSKLEVIEKAFEKVNKVVDGKAIWDWIESEIAEQGLSGECDLYDKLMISNNYSEIVYTVNIENNYDERKDLCYTNIKLISIKVEGELIV